MPLCDCGREAVKTDGGGNLVCDRCARGTVDPIRRERRLSRNEKCGCGSGKKYKVCCMKR